MRALFGLVEGSVPPHLELTLVHLGRSEGHDPRPFWARDLGTFWETHDGERWTKHTRDHIAGIATVEDGAWETLDWSQTRLVNPESIAGWLGPEAEWVGCQPIWHDVVAHLVLRMGPFEAEKTWAHVHDMGYVSTPKQTGRFTPKQASWLRTHGYLVGDRRLFEKRELTAWEAAAIRPVRPPRDGD